MSIKTLFACIKWRELPFWRKLMIVTGLACLTAGLIVLAIKGVPCSSCDSCGG